MGVDIYTNNAEIYTEQFTQKEQYSILEPPTFNYAGASLYIIPPAFEYRPDLISYAKYGTIKFEDVIIMFNKLIDPIKDFYAGRTLYLPSTQEAIRILEGE